MREQRTNPRHIETDACVHARRERCIALSIAVADDACHDEVSVLLAGAFDDEQRSTAVACTCVDGEAIVTSAQLTITVDNGVSAPDVVPVDDGHHDMLENVRVSTIGLVDCLAPAADDSRGAFFGIVVGLRRWKAARLQVRGERLLDFDHGDVIDIRTAIELVFRVDVPGLDSVTLAFELAKVVNSRQDVYLIRGSLVKAMRCREDRIRRDDEASAERVCSVAIGEGDEPWVTVGQGVFATHDSPIE